MEQLQQTGNATMAYIVAFICNLVLVYMLAWVLIHTGEQTAARGMKVGALLWLGLVATTTATEYVFEVRSLEIFAINAGHPLVGMLIMGAIVGAWKKKKKAQVAGLAPDC